MEDGRQVAQIGSLPAQTQNAGRSEKPIPPALCNYFTID